MIKPCTSKWEAPLAAAARALLRLSCRLLMLCSAAASANWQVQATLDDKDELWTLRWCKAGASGSPLSLRADDVLAMQLLQRTEPEADRRGTRSLHWQRLEQDCVSLYYDLGAIADRQLSGIGYHIGNDLLSWSWTWWWRPVTSDGATSGTQELRIALPDGWKVSAPWPRCGTNCWRLGTTPGQWPALLALGHFSLVEARLPGGVIEAAALGELSSPQRERLQVLLHAAAQTIQAAHGRISVPHLQLQTPLFATLAERIGSGRDFPDLSDALRKLDLDTRNPLSGAAAQGAAKVLREQIMGSLPTGQIE